LRGEILRGLALLPVVFVGVLIVAGSLRLLLPWTHNVPDNPLTKYMRTPAEAVVFTVVVILAGGVREEIQRAFILHRFEQRLGGARVGLVVFSLAFGALHLYEGVDSAIVVGLLGLMWGVIYLRRRSAIISMTNHAGFDAAQVMQLILVKAFGG
jgi:membrane protease YdiL (CAAX protease family)